MVTGFFWIACWLWTLLHAGKLRGGEVAGQGEIAFAGQGEIAFAGQGEIAFWL